MPALRNKFRAVSKMVAINTAAALGCVGCAFLWFGGAFAAEESRATLSPEAALFLYSIASIIAMLGFAVLLITKKFPWIAVVLTPLLMVTIMGFQPDRDIGLGLQLGCYASCVFVAGALAGCLLRRWVSAKGFNSAHGSESPKG